MKKDDFSFKIGKRTKVQYDFYVAVLMYEYCPEEMQTVSMVEKIIDLASERWLRDFSESNVKTLHLAENFVCLFLNVEVTDTLLNNWTYMNLLNLLKQNARSPQVKAYFGL